MRASTFIVLLLCSPPFSLVHAQAPLVLETQKLEGAYASEQLGKQLDAHGRHVVISGYDDSRWVRKDLFGWVEASVAVAAPSGLDVDRDEVAIAGFLIDARTIPWPQDATHPGWLDAEQSMVTYAQSVAVDGDWMALGVPSAALGGEVQLFQRGNGVWSYYETVTGDELAGERFGHAVDLDGTTLLVGAPSPDSGRTGKAHTFALVSGSWVATGSLVAPGMEADNEFGWRVAVREPWVAVSAPEEDTAFPQNFATDAGAVYVFRRGYLGLLFHNVSLFGNNGSGDYFGSSMAFDGVNLLVGAPFEDVGTKITVPDRGTATLYWRRGQLWQTAARLAPSDGAAGDRFGTSVGLSGVGPVVGAPYSDDVDDSEVDAGGFYFYSGWIALFLDGFESGDTSAWSDTQP